MTIDQMTLCVVLAIAFAVIFLVVMAVRQSRQNRQFHAHAADARAACDTLGSRIETVASNCEAEFCGVKGRLVRLEGGN